MNYKKDIKQVDKLIKQAKSVYALIERSEKRIAGNASFKISGFLGRNFFGDLIRNNKVSSINSTIEKLQEELLSFQKDLLLFDDNLARKLDLPVKLAEFSSSRTVFSDIILRTKMRTKEMEVLKLKGKIKTIVKRLYKEREKINYNMRKEAELKHFR